MKRKKVLKNCVAGLLMFTVLSVCWIAVLSAKYQRFTISTVGKYNFDFIRPGNVGKIQVVDSGLHRPPNSTAISAWEDPSKTKLTNWSPFNSQQDFLYYVKHVYSNSYALYTFINDFSPIAFAILLIAMFTIINSCRSVICIMNHKITWVLLTIVLYTSGYCLVLVLERYIWPVYFLILLMLGVILTQVFEKYTLTSGGKYLLLVVTSLFFIVSPIKAVAKHLNMDKEVKVLADELKNTYHLQGKVASDTDWFNTLFICYYLKCSYYGATRGEIDKEKLKQILKNYEIDYFIDWQNKGSDFDLSEYPEITHGESKKMKIYKLN